MREIKVLEGSHFGGHSNWLVFLTDPDTHKWQVLACFSVEREAIEWAATLLNDLAAQRARMI